MKNGRDYEVEVFAKFRSPQTRIEIVRAYTAEDADFQARQRWGSVNSVHNEWYTRIIGPADAPPMDGLTWTAPAAPGDDHDR